MLKTANKLTKKALVPNNQRRITTHHVYDNSTLRYQARKDILDTQASVRHHVGFLRLNREHRHNMLTPNFIKNIRRSLETLNLDQIVKVIYMTGGKGEQFSNGTDFRTLLHYKKEGSDAKIAAYLEELYGLQVQASKLNKPLITVAPGHSYNSGAALLQATGMPTVTLDSKLSFNEATFGFVPHGGSSYYLSRLPGEIGTFLALTGFPITGIDAKTFGIADELVHFSSAFEEEICDTLFAMEFPIPNGEYLSNINRQNPWLQRILERKKSQESAMLADEFESARKKQDQIIHEEFVEPKNKVPSLTAKSDLMYKKELQRYNQRFTGEEEFGYLENRDEGMYMNYYNYVMGYVKSHSGHEFPKDPRTLLTKNAQAINRIFYSSSLEEIIDNLKREDSSFSKLCLEKMSQNSTLSMKLALKMLRQSRNLDFKGCLQNEINVALNKIQDKEFDTGVQQILLKASGANATPTNLFSKDISESQVQSYFEQNKWTKEVQLDLVEKAMLPTRFYYEKFSDQVRLWVNEDSTPQPDVREHFEVELKEALREQGIDLRDRALTIESAREQLYYAEQLERQQTAFNQRLTQMLSDTKLRDAYFERATEHLSQLESKPQAFSGLVNSKIQAIFETAYLEKLNAIYSKSQEAHGLEKRRMFIKFKKFLFQSRILTYAHEETERLYEQLSNMPERLPHLTEQWDGAKSFLEMEHPEIAQSFLSHLSKAIGKSSLAPPELAKQFLTSGATAAKLTTYTFDKAELERLRDDILANPLKYEHALRKSSEDSSSQQFGYKLATSTKKREEHDYWFRVLNEGALPHDSLPYYKQLVAYKDFVESIEAKAFNTLKLTVQRLLNDFENSEDNTVNQFAQKEQRETKNQAIRRLMAVINQVEDINLPSTSQRVNTKQQYHLTQSARTTKDIKRFINRLVEEDSEISKLIPHETSSLANKFREEVLGELYQLIEFVLVNNATKRAGSALPPKHLLQERLASLTNPANTQQRNVTNLRMLDTFLNEANSEALVKDAIKLVKPFFFVNVLKERLEQESARVFQAFKAEGTANDVMHYYLFNLWYPEARHHSVTQRMLTFNENRDREMYFESLFPDQSQAYAFKRYVSMLGQDNTATNKDQLEAYVKQQYEGLAAHGKKSDATEAGYFAEQARERKEVMARAYDQTGDVDKEIDQHAMLNIHNYDAVELEQIFDYANKAENLRNYIELNEQQLRNSFTQEEFLHMFGVTVKEYGLDMDAIMRFSHYQRKAPEEYQNELQSIFANSNLSKAQMTWENIADYSLFLSQLYEQTSKASMEHGAKANYELMTDYIVKQMNIVDGEELLQSQSVYEKFKHTKLTIGQIGLQREAMREQVKDFAKLQQRLLSERKARENVEFLAQTAPKDVRQIVNQVLSSKSDYLSLGELEKMLLNKEFDKLKSGESIANIIDRERIFADLRKNSGLKKFLDNYQNTRLDVVSLTEARETVLNAPTSTHFDEKLQSQMRQVLDFVEDQLRMIPHARREGMKLGDFLSRHPYVSGGAGNQASLEQYLSSILKNKLEEVIGSQIDVNAAEFIDWEYGSVKTNPVIHQQEDARVQAALAQGKGYNAEATAEAIVESQQHGRGYEALGEPAAAVSYINPLTNAQEMKDHSQYEYEQVLRDAKRLTEARPEFHLTKYAYENEILRLYSQPDFDQVKVQELIHKYTELRLKDCMLNSEFKERVNTGNNGHIYIKMLKEQIVDELKLSQQAKVSDFAFTKIFHDPNFQPSVDVEGRYNTTELSNLQTVGLDKLINSESQTSTLDRLLGEYFLQKRGQYVATNELLDQLNKHFGDKTVKFAEGHKFKVKDKNQTNPDVYPIQDNDPNLAFAHLLQTIKKETDPRIVAQDFTALMELDIATQRALQDGKNGMNEALRINFEENQEAVTIPEHFNMFDVRKPAAQYVEDKLGDLLDQVFDVRKKVEKTLTRNELLAYDRTLASHLTKDTLLPRLKESVMNDKNNLLQLQQSSDMLAEGKKNEEFQSIKHRNEQPEFNEELKNEDALYKFLAYSGMLEKKRREDINKTRKNNEMIYGLENFEEFYKGELKKDSKSEPRPINPIDYQTKRVDNTKAAEGFRNSAQREADYFQEFELFKENKREQQERNQLFFVLEQFFSHAKQNPNPLNKAQEAIVDYFKDTENTFFFDKNKIQ